MRRRSFLVWAGGTAAAAGLGSAAWRWQELEAQVRTPGRAEGHFLRDRGALPAPSERLDTDIVILGSGIAGLTAAWKLQRAGHADHLLIDGPEPDGNAAGGSYGALAYPTGAHYLPLPSQESFHVREILHDLGILLRHPEGLKPYYDERCILHAPEERLLIDGRWQEGLIPTEGIGAGELAEHQRFFAEIDRLRNLRGADGRRMFAFPSVLSSDDPQSAQLDRITLKQWLQQQGYRSPSLHWYLDYACRDDYGATADQVSAWAGLHYFCSRSGEAENAAAGAWLTWPDGLQPLATGLRNRGGNLHRAGTAVSVKASGSGVEVLCMTLENGRPRTYTVRARKAICAMPLFVASRIVEGVPALAPAAVGGLSQGSPWLVANFLVKGMPEEVPEAPLSWDNVVYGTKGLGYVVSTAQDIRVAPPERSVFTSYVALAHLAPKAARRWLESAPPAELLELAIADLKAAYGWRFARHVERVDLTVRAHAMAVPTPGFRSNAARLALRALDGAILVAHADLSGFSVFEEASWWGYQAAMRALAK